MGQIGVNTMAREGARGFKARVARIAVAAVILAAAGATIGHVPTQVFASTPSALALVDHALTSQALLADESPYELIDPVGPGGITRSQAVNEVTASTMIGGLSNDNNGRYGGGYGQLLYVQPIELEQHAYSGHRVQSTWGGYQR
jgi:hypothetical protein